MSTAKQMVMNELLNVSDDVQDEFEVLESLYKLMKLLKLKFFSKNILTFRHQMCII